MRSIGTTRVEKEKTIKDCLKRLMTVDLQMKMTLKELQEISEDGFSGAKQSS
jgi:hypothetical protein